MNCNHCKTPGAPHELIDGLCHHCTTAACAEMRGALSLIKAEAVRCSTEVQDSYGSIPGFPLEGAIERNLTEVRNLSPHIPADVALGYHFCFGTLGGWPRFQPGDLSQAVKLVNGFVSASGRKVDWVHIPTLDTVNEAFYAPLKDLKPQGARVYLGNIHNMGNFRQRLAVARKYLPEFGLGAYCGFGRMPVAELPNVLADHLEAVDIAGRG